MGFTTSQLENNSCMCWSLFYFYWRAVYLSGNVLTGCWVHEVSSISHTVQNPGRVVKINNPPLLPFSYCWYIAKFTAVWSSGDLHVFSDRCVADGVGCSRDGRFAAVTAATAVQAGHVDPVEVIMVLPSSMAQGLVLAVFITPANTTKQCEITTTRGTPCPMRAMTKEHRKAMWSRFAFILSHVLFQFHLCLRERWILCCLKPRRCSFPLT